MIICGTGHRPNKVGGYGVAAEEKLVKLAHRWLHERHGQIERVISGGALGWDQALGWAAVRVGLPLTMALPFKDFDDRWPSLSRGRFNLLCAEAANVIYVNEPGYEVWKMQQRNKYMVHEADTILALWDGTSGGTANCVQYARKVGKPIVNLWERYNEHTKQTG